MKGHCMTSQTRLDSDQAELLNMMLEDNSGVSIFHFPTVGSGICVVIKQTGVETAKFAVSIASPEEMVYRYDVAEYNALTRWESGIVMPCNLYPRHRESMYTILGQKAYDIASALA